MIKFVIVTQQGFRGRFTALRGLQFGSKEDAQKHIDTNFREAYRNRYHIESREIKADDSSLRMTCQCCSRSILANTGLIAHHGYERPGHGWQTASCFGAKRLPWEVDREAVGDLIKFLKKSLNNQIKWRKEVADETTPVTHRYSVYNRQTGKRDPKAITFTRETFDEMKKTPGAGLVRGDGYYEDKTFDQCKENDLKGYDTKIAHTKRDIKEFTKRYEGWKPTHKRGSSGHPGDWAKI